MDAKVRQKVGEDAYVGRKVMLKDGRVGVIKEFCSRSGLVFIKIAGEEFLHDEPALCIKSSDSPLRPRFVD